MKKRIRLGILFGGRSGEHEISLLSAASVLQALDPAKYEVIPIGITREGQWRVGSTPRELARQPERLLHSVLGEGRPVTASADPRGPWLLPAVRAASGARRIGAKLDVVFPLLHGTFGEDGTVQGLLELAGVAYVGAGVLASAAGMDKDAMKRLFRDAGLPVVPWVLVLRRDWEQQRAGWRRRIGRKIGYPLFVKPANLGSSVGISKVHGPRELAGAIDLAARYDHKVVVEAGVDAREIECSVLGNDRPIASVPGEVIPVNEFYDYEAKYLKEGSELVIPARLPGRQSREVQRLALRAFAAIDGAGMARVDFLLDRATGKLFANEINTIPGFTPISMYPKLWAASGIPYPELVDRLVALALERHAERQRSSFGYPRRDRQESPGSGVG
ncbi:MAG TPA: D-alanine--D-alanine ligase family protein [Terriglobia bacterium]|nr:D-alanine--D-alanine ligase family protein [Terriglobia bacterium]